MGCAVRYWRAGFYRIVGGRLVMGFIGGLVPPDLDDKKAVSRWLWLMWSKMVAIFVFVVWALDLVPGFPGFARAADMQQMSAEIQITRIEILEANLFDLRVKQCSSENFAGLRQAYGEQLSRLLRTYYTVTGSRYDLPECNDVR